MMMTMNRCNGSSWARDRKNVIAKSHDNDISLECSAFSGRCRPPMIYFVYLGEAPTEPMWPKSCMVGDVHDVITSAKFQIETYRGYDFTWGRIFDVLFVLYGPCKSVVMSSLWSAARNDDDDDWAMAWLLPLTPQRMPGLHAPWVAWHPLRIAILNRIDA